jgi:hypothetical protein
MHSNSQVRCSRWRWKADSVLHCLWIVSSIKLAAFAFLLYLEYLIYVTVGIYLVF